MADDDTARDAGAQGGVGPEGFDRLKRIGRLREPGALEEGVDYPGDESGELLGCALCLTERKDVFAATIGVKVAVYYLVDLFLAHLIKVFALQECDIFEGEEVLGEGDKDDVGGDGVFGDEMGGVFGEAEGSGEDFVVDAFFPAVRTEGLEVGLEACEGLGRRQLTGFDGGAVEGGDDVEVEGGGRERLPEKPLADKPVGEFH